MKRPEIITTLARLVFGHSDKERMMREVAPLGWSHVRTVESSGAWWLHNGVHEVLVTFGGPYRQAAAAVWRISGGPAEVVA